MSVEIVMADAVVKHLECRKNIPTVGFSYCNDLNAKFH